MAAGRSPAQIEHGPQARKRPGSRGQPQADTGAGPASASAPRPGIEVRSARDIGPVLRLAERATAAAPDHVARSPPRLCAPFVATLAASPVKPTGNAVVRRPFGEIEGTEVLRDALRAPPGRSDVLPWAPIRIRLTPKRRDVGVKQSAATEGGSRHARDQALAARRGDPAGWRRRPGRRSRKLSDRPVLGCRLDRHHLDHRGHLGRARGPRL